jgi:hypothetical protein
MGSHLFFAIHHTLDDHQPSTEGSYSTTSCIVDDYKILGVAASSRSRTTGTCSIADPEAFASYFS